MLEWLNTAHMPWGPWLASNLWLFKMTLKTVSDFKGKLIIIKEMVTWRQTAYIRYSDIFRKLYITLRMKQSNIVFWLTHSPTTYVFWLGTFAGDRGGESLPEPNHFLPKYNADTLWLETNMKNYFPLNYVKNKKKRLKYKLSPSNCHRKKWNKEKNHCSRLNIFSHREKKIGKNTLKYYFIFIRPRDYFCWIFVYPQ